MPQELSSMEWLVGCFGRHHCIHFRRRIYNLLLACIRSRSTLNSSRMSVRNPLVALKLWHQKIETAKTLGWNDEGDKYIFHKEMPTFSVLICPQSALPSAIQRGAEILIFRNYPGEWIHTKVIISAVTVPTPQSEC